MRAAGGCGPVAVCAICGQCQRIILAGVEFEIKYAGIAVGCCAGEDLLDARTIEIDRYIVRRCRIREIEIFGIGQHACEGGRGEVERYAACAG